MIDIECKDSIPVNYRIIFCSAKWNIKKSKAKILFLNRNLDKFKNI